MKTSEIKKYKRDIAIILQTEQYKDVDEIDEEKSNIVIVFIACQFGNIGSCHHVSSPRLPNTYNLVHLKSRTPLS